MYRFPWYLTLVNTNHASSNPGQFAGILMVKAVVTRGNFTKVDIKSVNVIWGRFPQVNFHGKVTEHSRKFSKQNTVWIENCSVCLGKPTSGKTNLDYSVHIAYKNF